MERGRDLGIVLCRDVRHNTSLKTVNNSDRKGRSLGTGTSTGHELYDRILYDDSFFFGKRVGE